MAIFNHDTIFMGVHNGKQEQHNTLCRRNNRSQRESLGAQDKSQQI